MAEYVILYANKGEKFMYIWSLTFLILPVAAVVVGIGAFFAIKAIARKVKRKAAAQKAAKQVQGKEKTKEIQQEKTPEKTTEALVTKHQPAPAINPQVQQQTTDIVAPVSDAEYIRKLGTFPYDLKDHDMVAKDMQKLKQLSIAWKDFKTTDSEEVRIQTEKNIQELVQYFNNEYDGRRPITHNGWQSAGNYVAQVDGEKDWRNYCFDGNGAPNFKKACEEIYSAQKYDSVPTIFQVDSEGREPLVVSATHKDLFKAGLMDIKTTMKAQKINDCTFRLVTDENGRKLITQQGTIKDIDKFIKDHIHISSKEDDLAK